MSVQAEELRADEDPQEDPVPQERAPDRIREIDWTAGHGVARAYGFRVLAAAYGVRAELLRGGTHSGRVPLTVAVYGPDEAGEDERERTLDIVSELYDVLAPEAEKCAKERREHVRRETPDAAPTGYEINRFSRAVIAGFLQGAAGVLKTPHALKTEGYRVGSRARAVDEGAHRAGLNAGRAYARSNLLAQQREAA